MSVAAVQSQRTFVDSGLHGKVENSGQVLRCRHWWGRRFNTPFLAGCLCSATDGYAIPLRHLLNQCHWLVPDWFCDDSSHREDPSKRKLALSDSDWLHRWVYDVLHLRVRNAASDSGWSIHS